MVHKKVVMLAVAAMAALMLGCNDNYVKDVEGNNARAREIKKTIVDLQAADPAARAQAAQHLGQIQADDPGAIGALGDHLTDPNASVRMASANSLSQIGTARSFEELRTAARHGWPEARNVYDASVSHLRSRASQGDGGAQTLLRELGEKAIPAPGTGDTQQQGFNDQSPRNYQYGMPEPQDRSQQYPDDWKQQNNDAQPKNSGY